MMLGRRPAELFAFSRLLIPFWAGNVSFGERSHEAKTTPTGYANYPT